MWMCLKATTSSQFFYKSKELLIVSKLEYKQLEVHNGRANHVFPDFASWEKK